MISKIYNLFVNSLNMDNSDRLSTLIGAVRSSLAANSLVSGQPESEAWLFRDDVGAPHGIKGYEE